MNIDQFNRLSESEAETLLRQTCAASNWVKQMLGLRPFSSTESVLESAKRVWQSMNEADWLEAFDGHPKIGDPNSLKKKYRDTRAMAKGEQAGVEQADHSVIDQLAEANRIYLDRFGFIYIICASGKSAQQMLDNLLQRLDNSPQQELAIAAEEQAKITAIRLQKTLSNNKEPS